MSKTVFMRGLNNFIEDVRDCKNQEQEAKRVEKELAKIREKFGDDKGLSGYDKRKYVWKLLYVHVLGYPIDFGHKQACDLIPKPKYKDKQVGYMACAILLNENDEFLRLAINGIHLDLISRNEAFECLALNFVGTVGGREMAEALVPDILKLLANGSSRPLVKKRAALCLLRLLHKTPLGQEVVRPDTFCSILNELLEERDLGLLLSTVTLLLGILARNGPAGYEPTQPRLMRVLERLTTVEEGKGRDVPPEYLYYGVPCPWLQSKTLRALQYFAMPDAEDDRALLKQILNAVTTIVPTNFKSNPNKANALHSITFEGIQLILLLNPEQELRAKAIETLTGLLEAQQANVVYLALEALSRLTSTPDILESIRLKKGTITSVLKGPDASVRKKALDLLFAMCDASVAPDMVAELLDYLTECDFSLQEDLVLKIAILTEKFAPTVQWYVDSTLTLLERGGDFVSEDIWQRTVQLVTNNDTMQKYAAGKVVQVLRRGCLHESIVATSAFLLGEYGRLIKDEVPLMEQYNLLAECLATCTTSTRGLLMTAFVKMCLQDPDDAALRAAVTSLFVKSRNVMDTELQQRAAEYLALANAPCTRQSTLHSTEYLALANAPADANTKFVLPMPKWPERESTLLRQLQKNSGISDEVASSAAAYTAAAALREAPSAELAAPAVPTATAAATAAPPASPLGDLLASEPSVGTPVPGPPPAVAVPAEADPFDMLVSPGGAVASAAPASPADLLAGMFDAPAAAAMPAAAAAAPPPAMFPAGAQLTPAAALPSAHTSFSPPPAVYTPPPPPAPMAPQPGMFDSPPAFAAPPAAAPAASFHAPAAGFGDDPFGEDSAFGPLMSTFEPARATVDLAACFNALLYKDRGVLYEDQYLQAGLQLEFCGGQGDATLFLGNKHPSHSLTAVSVAVTPSAGVGAVLAAPVTACVVPGQQVRAPIKLTCVGAVADVPVTRLHYVLGNVTVQQDLRIPVSNHHFLVPEPHIAKELFFEQWRVVGTPPNKAQEMVSRASVLSTDQVLAVMHAVGLGGSHGYLDPSPYNEAGAAFFTMGAPGAEARSLVMCRVEGNPQNMTQFRVTVVSALPVLSASIKDMLVKRISA